MTCSVLSYEKFIHESGCVSVGSVGRLASMTTAIDYSTIPSHMDQSEVEAIDAWLSGQRNTAYGNAWYLGSILSWHGAMLLMPPVSTSLNALLLALDNHGGAYDMRRVRLTAQWVLEQRGVEFLPISWTAYSRTRRPSSTHPRLTVIHRDGLHAVFRIDGEAYGDGEVYLSAYDHHESPPLYFLAQLPHAVSSYDEAIEALKPPSVKEAELLGLSVLRQGDMFFIPTAYRTRDLKTMEAKFVTVKEFRSDGQPYTLYGTAHYAEEMAVLPDGVMLARGTVTHHPRMIDDYRDPDHSPLALPVNNKKWYITVRNTVPLARRPRRNPTPW